MNSDDIAIENQKNYKKELEEFSQLKKQLRDLKEEVSKKRKKYLRAKFLYYHPYASVLQFHFSNIFDVIQLCLDYIGEKLCMECKQLYFGDVCIHNLTLHKTGSHWIYYILKGDLIPHTNCSYACNDDDIVASTYNCYEVENEEDRKLLTYWKSTLQDELDVSNDCSLGKHQFPFFLSWNTTFHLTISKGHKITLVRADYFDSLRYIITLNS